MDGTHTHKGAHMTTVTKGTKDHPRVVEGEDVTFVVNDKHVHVTAEGARYLWLMVYLSEGGKAYAIATTSTNEVLRIEFLLPPPPT